MSATGRMIPRRRLRWMPKELQLAHEYAFFLHDEAARLLVEYEGAKAHFVKVRFKSKKHAKAFDSPGDTNGLSALRALGYEKQTRRIILNQITMAMVSDCLHHIYEALICLEKRKVVVACNLLRKPLFDSLAYLSWMLGDEDGFYAAFTSGDPEALTHRKMGNHRLEVLRAGIGATEIDDIVDAHFVQQAVFDAKNAAGLYGLFQHAVHLITVDRLELRTGPENFNFIFKDYSDDDLYELLYALLPGLLLVMSHVILELFDRMKRMDRHAKKAFVARSKFGYYLVEGGRRAEIVIEQLGSTLSPHVSCYACSMPAVVTAHNAARILLTDSFRCTRCRRSNPFPFSWTF